ncbi:hypothetical protein [Mesorhizobium sp. NFR06]|uniref:hypothetical protein n=1 Tax=Mesorhizobium sp. NFR06 TaxID=1566290 RepID=UPI00122CBB69|nr:hypothetical protein [Mesorhizobium sp. NFR06]
MFQSNRWNGLRCCQYIRGQRPASFQGSNERDAAPDRRIAFAIENSERDWRGSDGAKAKLNQINDLYMRLNRAQSKAAAAFLFFLVK